MNFKKDFQIEKVPSSMVKITGEIPYEELEKHRAKAIKELGQNLKVDGFRPGHVPEAVVVQKVGEIALLTEMAERALAAVYPEVLKAHEIDPIGRPEIQITKIAPGNPLGFIATVAVLPTIELPDYKSLAQAENASKSEVMVTEEDVEKQAQDILRQKAAYERLQANARKNAELTHTDAEETHTHADGTVHSGPAHVEESDVNAITKAELPELTDEVVKALGAPGQFENVADFKAKLREHLEIEKKREAEAKHRAALTDKIIAASSFELPPILIDSEIGQMFAQMEEDIKRAGLSVDDYLNHMKKTREDLKKEWTPTAEKRARLQLVLNEIAKKESILPEKEAVEHEVKHLLEHYKNADETRVRIYVASVLQNEAVMKFLESQ